MFVRKSIFCLLLVASVLCGRLMAQAPAAEEDIRGPKPQVEIPQPQTFPIMLWVAVGSVIVFGIPILILWRKHAGRKRYSSPLVTAFASLAELEKSRNQLAAEAFANRAAGTVRQYIADRFGIAAPRRTTEEFFRELGCYGLEPVIAESDPLKAFLKSCDLAKFAGTHLDASQRDELIQAARGFITVTSAPNIKEVKS